MRTPTELTELERIYENLRAQWPHASERLLMELARIRYASNVK